MILGLGNWPAWKYCRACAVHLDVQCRSNAIRRGARNSRNYLISGRQLGPLVIIVARGRCKSVYCAVWSKTDGRWITVCLSFGVFTSPLIWTLILSWAGCIKWLRNGLRLVFGFPSLLSTLVPCAYVSSWHPISFHNPLAYVMNHQRHQTKLEPYLQLNLLRLPTP